MVVLAFSPGDLPGYIVSSGSSTDWLFCPQDLVQEVQQSRSKSEILQDVAIGCNGHWFLKTNKSNYYNSVSLSGTVNSVGVFLRATPGRSIQAIQHFAFMPDPLGYYCVYRNNDGKDRAVWSRLPTSLQKHLDSVVDQCLRRNTYANGSLVPVPFMRCSVGHNESWVVVQDNGRLDFCGVSTNLGKRLKSTARGCVKQVVLSFTALDQYFIEHVDGTTHYGMPRAWHAVIDSHEVYSARPTVQMSQIPTYEDAVTNEYVTSNISSRGIIEQHAGPSREVSREADMDLQISFKPPLQGIFYMPGDEINGWVKCRSSCFNRGTAASVNSVRVSLVGECCVFVPDINGIERFDSEEIINHTINVYNADNPFHREMVETPRQFIKLPFTLLVAETTTSQIGIASGQNGIIPLPPSFQDHHVMEHRYIKYWVSAWGTRLNGDRPCIDKKEIKVMPWDPEPTRPQFRFPLLKSSNPFTNALVLQDPKDEWNIITHWTPLKPTTHERIEYFGAPLPKDNLMRQSIALCNGCHKRICGPRFICCGCNESDFNWCWTCMSDLTKRHPVNHMFVRIESSADLADYRRRNVAVRAMATATSHLGLQSDTNTVVHLTGEVTHEVWMPKRKCYSFDAEIPLLQIIKVSSMSREALNDLLPTLLCDSSSGTWDGTRGPAARLRVDIESYVEDQTQSVPFGEYYWYSPSARTPGSDLSRDWSTPSKNAFGHWEQLAVVCQTIGSSTRKEQAWIEPHINLLLLQSRFNLSILHSVGGQNVEILLSDAPWTSGRHRGRHNSASASDHRISLSALPHLTHSTTTVPGILNVVTGNSRADGLRQSRTTEHEHGPLMSTSNRDPPPAYDTL